MTVSAYVTPSAESVAQRSAALHRANEIRSARADYKRYLRRTDPVLASLSVQWLIDPPPDWARTWCVDDLLRAIPQVGAVQARRWLVTSGIPSHTPIGRLTVRQRLALIAALDTWRIDRKTRGLS